MSLVDSGADVTLVDMRFVRQMQPRPKIREANLTIRDGQNNQFRVYGIADLELTGQGGLSLTFPAYVVQGLSSSAILGWDFQRHTEAVIDAGTGKVRFGNPSPSAPWPDPEPATFVLQAVKAYDIPANSSRTIMASVCTDEAFQMAPGSTLLIEPTPSMDFFTPEALVNVREANLVKLVCLNAKPWAISIPKEAPLPGVTATVANEMEIFAASAEAVENIANDGRPTPSGDPPGPCPAEKEQYLLQHLNLQGVDEEVKQRTVG